MFTFIAILLLSAPFDDRASIAAYIAVASLSPSMDTTEVVPEVKPEPTPAIPRVQLLIFAGKQCPPCIQLKANLQKQLVDDVKGEKKWKINEERDAHFRYVYDDRYPKEFTKRNITSIPHLIWRVDGVETKTSERDPRKLAEEYNKKFKELSEK